MRKKVEPAASRRRSIDKRHAGRGCLGPDLSQRIQRVRAGCRRVSGTRARRTVKDGRRRSLQGGASGRSGGCHFWSAADWSRV